MNTSTNVEGFDLRSHAVIEASAGTGKTYTIEQLVRRLLVDEHLKLDQILVVTFTEKATCELKERLRAMIERELTGNPHLKAALDQFDQAPIFTIHGFCKRLAQDYILEQGGDFQPEIASDPELIESLLREVERKVWPREFGDRLGAVLQKAEFDRDGAGKFESRVLEIARRYRPGAEHQLQPPPAPDWFHRLDDAAADWRGQLEVFTLLKLHELLREHKKQRGLQSFDDMIADVDEALDPFRNPDAENFRNVLRERYRFGIVDEFQDTDRLQWNIFRSIFLTGGESRLIVVGDPKQAIYGFRGSDLPTYHRAATELTTASGAASFPLDVNWRSDPRLLDALNCLFDANNLFPANSKITYQPVRAPAEENRRTRIERDDSGRPALSIVDVTAPDKLKNAKKQFAQFTAMEIRRLLFGDDGTPLVSFAQKGQPARPLRAADICVLVLTRSEAESVMQALDNARIRSSFYKQQGLWQTDEAIHLSTLLQTLAQPDDRVAFRKALLTFFFRIRPHDLAQAPDLPSHHSARQQYRKWLGLAESRHWSALSQSLLEETGLLIPDAASKRAPNLTTLRALLAALELAAYEANLDLLGVLDWLDNLGNQRDRDDADVVPVEMSTDRVQIMTVHAAKGLEFPIVFLAGGITQLSYLRGPICYRDENDRLVFDVCTSDDGKNRAKTERLDEQRRLLYVALTRPELKLYVPKVGDSFKTKPYAGPVTTILLSALEQANLENLDPDTASLVTPPPASRSPPSATAAIAPREKPIVIEGPLLAPIDRTLHKRRIYVRSFSSMARHHLTQIGQGTSFGEETPRAHDENVAGADADDPLRGPVFGDMVHKVLEEIDFAEVQRAGSPEDLWRPGSHARQCLDRMIQPHVAELRTRTPLEKLEEAARRQIAQLVWNGLKTPLAAIGGSLCAIDKRHRLHEIDFLFPENISGSHAPSEGFVTGFMDLLFRGKDRYFLLDWKTNLLPGYGPDVVARSMDDSDYHRQYRLYLHAIERWLRRVSGPDFRFRDQFGGVYYLYLRGMNGRDESSGVFFHAPTEADLQLGPLLQ